ncbi:MAG: crossover junction endodeoxyribonuclease RuvC [Microgenomates group bacterium]
MKILAIDAGVERTGYAIFKDKELISSGVILTSKNELIETRLKKIYQTLAKIIKTYKPQLLVLEKLFYFKNQKTIISVANVQGIILLLAGQHKIKIEYLTPLQIKQAITGDGRADKKAIEKILTIEYQLKKRKYDDEVDAIACGIAYNLLKNNKLSG